ncbi:MAG: VWA domain-containing protein [Planctomycetes bacterium]|nr:VWA domain-containing protein [Planctomycetota bacterium]
MIAFDRPWALVSLAVPLVVMLAALQARRAPRVSTGTLMVWRQVPATAARASARRWTPPWSLLLLVGALCAGCLALAGARASARAEPRWMVLVDRSPSMYASSSGPTALERALDALEARVSLPREYRAVSGEFLSAAVDAVPEDWLARPHGDWEEPDWQRWDEPGVVWITDRARGKPAHAGLLAVGGEDGASLHPTGRAGVYIDARLQGTLFGDLALSWCAARGLALAASTDEALFSLRSAGAEPARSVRCEQRGWALEGHARSLPPLHDEPSADWLVCDGQSVVRARPGVVEVALDGAPQLVGDDLEFALAFSRRLDRAWVERVDPPCSGPGEHLSGTPPSPHAPERSYAPWLATLAAAFGALALAVRS